MIQTKEIQKVICEAEIKKGNLVSENFGYMFCGEMDVISLNKSGYVSEFEVKISRSDFKADSKKAKWAFFDRMITVTVPNYFWYVCPTGLILENELKPFMGLMYFNGNDFEIVRKPKLIHKQKPDAIAVMSKMLRVNLWRHYFGGCELTVKNREIKERNARFVIGKQES